MAISWLAVGLALLVLVLFTLVLLSVAVPHLNQERRRRDADVGALREPPRCAWCDRQIEALDKIRVEMGVSYHARCFDLRNKGLRGDVP